MILKKYNKRNPKPQEYPKIQSKSNVQKAPQPLKPELDPIITNQLGQGNKPKESPQLNSPLYQQSQDYFIADSPINAPKTQTKQPGNKELLEEMEDLLFRYSIYFSPSDEIKAKEIVNKLKDTLQN